MLIQHTACTHNQNSILSPINYVFVKQMRERSPKSELFNFVRETFRVSKLKTTRFDALSLCTKTRDICLLCTGPLRTACDLHILSPPEFF